MDYQIQRSISDIQSKLAALDYRTLKMAAGTPDVAPGRKLVAQVAAEIWSAMIAAPIGLSSARWRRRRRRRAQLGRPN
jgi:hypothetical protein